MLQKAAMIYTDVSNQGGNEETNKYATSKVIINSDNNVAQALIHGWEK